ncbi:MAG: 7-carboxy-7-deazaguanine synthase QueE, partial [bacterium]|nr:7-carboxy-7-deazaguanine synthase QueE [bacterium]
MTNKVKIKEIFKSIQGEGAYIGYEQVFVRFCRCNLSCKYCDTDFLSKSENDAKIYSPQDLANIINSYKVHSVSLTGGEPLLEIEFLKEFLPICNLPIYLETNATLPQNLMQIIDYISYVS